MITDQLMQAIRDSGETMYATAKPERLTVDPELRDLNWPQKRLCGGCGVETFCYRLPEAPVHQPDNPYSVESGDRWLCVVCWPFHAGGDRRGPQRAGGLGGESWARD